MRDITIGITFLQQFGDMKRLRDAWMEAEALGVDRMYVIDHFNAQVVNKDVMNGEHSKVASGKNFEATMLQAAMAATTTRPQIGCIVHANSFRNPNLMADMARTIDHISDGRFILGMGSGYLRADYDEYGYEYGTVKSRLLDLARDIPIIKARFEKLNPKPIRKIPIMIASMGEEIGMRIVAQHADQWNIYGPLEKIAHKTEVLKRLCAEINRDFNEIELTVSNYREILKDGNPDDYVKLGFTHISDATVGPNWDLGALRELLAWRKSYEATLNKS